MSMQTQTPTTHTSNPALSSSSSPLLSPSKARLQQQEAQDWAYLQRWLGRLYDGKPIPRFERNSETKRALLELVAGNEGADGEREMMKRWEEEEGRRMSVREKGDDGGGEGEAEMKEVLKGLEEGLDQRGKVVLMELAEARMLLGTLSTDSVEMGERIVELSCRKFEVEELQLRRIRDLQVRLEGEMEIMRGKIKELVQSQIDEAAQEEMMQRAGQLNRETKQFNIKAGEYDERIAGLEKFVIQGPDLQEVKEEEKEVKKLQSKVKRLERQFADFHALPPDLKAAREEYQRAKNELQDWKRRRDELFQVMVDG